MLTTTILAAEQEGIVLLPDTSELIWGLVAFLLLMAIMMKFVSPKLNQTLSERGQLIQGKMEEADTKLAEADATRERYEASLADARGEANRIVEEARSAAETVRAELIANAESDAAAIVERARADVAAERERALQELRLQLGAISVELAGRIVERELDATTHEHLVDEYITRLSSHN